MKTKRSLLLVAMATGGLLIGDPSAEAAATYTNAAGQTVTSAGGSSSTSIALPLPINGQTLTVASSSTDETVTVGTTTVTLAPGSSVVVDPVGNITVTQGTMKGNDTVYLTGQTLLVSGGTLKPGNSPGVLTLQDSSVIIANNGTLQIDIDGAKPGNGAGYASQINGVGTTTFVAGGLLKPALGSDVSYLPTEASSVGYKNPPIGTGYTIVTTQAANGVTGAFTGLGTTNGARILGAGTQAALLPKSTFDVVYNPNSIVLYVTPSQYQNLSQSGISLSANQANAATALQSLRLAYRPLGVERLANTDLKSLFDNLAPQSASSLQSIYDQIGGGSIANFATSAVRTADLFSDTFTARAGQSRALAQTGVSGGEHGPSIAGWVAPVGQLGSVDSNGNGLGYSTSTYGAAAGIEATLNNAVIGAGFGYGRESIDSDSFGNKTTADNYVLGLYGQYAFGPAFVNGTVGYTWKNYNETRTLSIGSYNRGASGSTDGNTLNAAANIGYAFTPASFIVEPTLGFRYNSFSSSGFTESGAGALNLTVGKQDYDSLQSVLAVRVAKTFTLDNGLKVVPEVRLGWAHELLNTKSSITSSFAAGGGGFTVYGTQPGNDAALLGLGVKAKVTDQIDLYADYNGRFTGGSNDNGFALGLKYKFN